MKQAVRKGSRAGFRDSGFEEIRSSQAIAMSFTPERPDMSEVMMAASSPRARVPPRPEFRPINEI